MPDTEPVPVDRACRSVTAPPPAEPPPSRPATRCRTPPPAHPAQANPPGAAPRAPLASPPGARIDYRPEPKGLCGPRYPFSLIPAPPSNGVARNVPGSAQTSCSHRRPRSLRKSPRERSSRPPVDQAAGDQGAGDRGDRGHRPMPDTEPVPVDRACRSVTAPPPAEPPPSRPATRCRTPPPAHPAQARKN
jgi:hypothetical protein